MGHQSTVDALVLALDLDDNAVWNCRDVTTGVFASHDRKLLQVVACLALGQELDGWIAVPVAMRVILGA
jgi:hypothetical protein